MRGLQGQEAQIARAFENSDHIGALISYWGFVPLPSVAEGYTTDFQGHPAGGVTAVDYPEDLATGALPLNGAADTSNRYAVSARHQRRGVPEREQRGRHGGEPGGRHHAVQPERQRAAVPVRRDPRAGAPPLAGLAVVAEREAADDGK